MTTVARTPSSLKSPSVGNSFREKKFQISVLALTTELNGHIQTTRRDNRVQLSHASDRRVVCAERFEKSMDDLLQLKYTISRRLVTEIETLIQTSEVEHAVRLSTENLDTCSACHRELWNMFRFNPQYNKVAAQMLKHTINNDGHFARAHAGLSFTHFQEAFLRYSEDTTKQRDLARQHAKTISGAT